MFIKLYNLIVLFLVVLTACSMQEKSAKIGDTVSVHYTGTLDDGSVFDSSEDKEPLQFKIGAGEMIQGFDQAVIGMKVGEEKDVTLQPEEAYGYRDPTAIAVQPRENIDSEMDLEPGMTLLALAPDGSEMPVKILNITEDTVTIDMNHPFAGKVLHFNIRMIAIE